MKYYFLYKQRKKETERDMRASAEREKWKRNRDSEVERETAMFYPRVPREDAARGKFEF